MRRFFVLFVSALMVMILTVPPGFADVGITSETFPDDAFRNFVSTVFDQDGDGIITDAEISGITEIWVGGLGIESLKGIEYFTALEVLIGDHNRIHEVDLSKNINLHVLNLDNNLLTALDVSANKQLFALNFGNFYEDGEGDYHELEGNRVRTIDVSNNPLEQLECACNDMDNLDISHNPLLTYIGCGGNNLTALDVSIHSELQTLYCWGNQLSTLDVSHNSETRSA